MSSTSLLGSPTRVETPFIKVTIGDYSFGSYHETERTLDNEGFYKTVGVTYPNYVKSLQIQKINGQVNTYTLQFSYPIRPGDDPNFFEKVFSSVSQTRKILFSYGDLSLPNYIYKDEQALITKVQSNFNIKSSIITYTVTAVSSAKLGYSGSYDFNEKYAKPSEVIEQILYTPNYNLTELFYGMANRELVDKLQLIKTDDAVVEIHAKSKISPLEYIKYLVSLMRDSSESSTNAKLSSYYSMVICDEVNGETETNNTGYSNTNIETEQLGGPYFKICKVTKQQEKSDAYEIDIGYPTSNLVTAFNITDNENYSLYYDWQGDLNCDDYVMRLNDEGAWEKEYAPAVSTNTDHNVTTDADKIWWSKVTQYPISGSITIKGLIRPATLMEYVRLNVYYFGKKHIASGLYIVTKQVDQIDSSGYRTTLNLTKISGDNEEYYE